MHLLQCTRRAPCYYFPSVSLVYPHSEHLTSRPNDALRFTVCDRDDLFLLARLLTAIVRVFPCWRRSGRTERMQPAPSHFLLAVRGKVPVNCVNPGSQCANIIFTAHRQSSIRASPSCAPWHGRGAFGTSSTQRARAALLRHLHMLTSRRWTPDAGDCQAVHLSRQRVGSLCLASADSNTEQHSCRCVYLRLSIYDGS